VRSVGAVSVRACVRPRPSQNVTEWSTMTAPTYPDDDSRALKVYQHQHHGCVRVVCGSGTRRVSSEIGGTIELSRDCVGRFGWDLRGKTARSALYLTVKVWWRAVASPSTHDCVPPTKYSYGRKYIHTPHMHSRRSPRVRFLYFSSRVK
jgi:hypothetical protein